MILSNGIYIFFSNKFVFVKIILIKSLIKLYIVIKNCILITIINKIDINKYYLYKLIFINKE